MEIIEEVRGAEKGCDLHPLRRVVARVYRFPIGPGSSVLVGNVGWRAAARWRQGESEPHLNSGCCGVPQCVVGLVGLRVAALARAYA